MSIYVNTIKNNSSQNLKAHDLETWYAASGAQILPSLFKNAPGLTLTYFKEMSNFALYVFVWKIS